MKTKMSIGLMVLGSSFMAMGAQASSMVCAGESIYVSHVRKAFAAAPASGTVTGEHVYVLNGEVVLKYEDVVGLRPQGRAPYSLQIENEQTLADGVTSGMGVLYKVDPMNPQNREEAAREQVICRKI